MSDYIRDEWESVFVNQEEIAARLNQTSWNQAVQDLERAGIDGRFLPIRERTFRRRWGPRYKGKRTRTNQRANEEYTPRTTEERYYLRRNKRMVADFKISRDEENFPEYYMELDNRKWWEPRPEIELEKEDYEEQIYNTCHEQKHETKNWKKAQWCSLWNHALSRQSLKGFNGMQM